MKNITLKIDDETYRKARIRAAREGTSVSAMVKEFLTAHTDEGDDPDARRAAALKELYRLADSRGKARAKPLKPLTRDQIYAGRVR
jgi:plasmid stability protein